MLRQTAIHATPLLGLRAASSAAATGKRNVVLVDAVRIPFQRSGTAYGDLMAYDLQREAIKNLLARTAIDPKTLDGVVCGTVVQETTTSNIGREAMIGAGIPKSVPAYTVTMACISSNLAAARSIDRIQLGDDMWIAGGNDTMSDAPVRYNKKFRKFLLDIGLFRKLKTPQAILQRMWKEKLLPTPDQGAIAEFSTGEVMGHSADRLAARFGVTRKEQDEFALRSHMGAIKAAKEGWLEDITPMMVPNLVKEDNVARADLTLEKLAKLKPSFIKPHGTVTAGSSSALTDGASACLIMSEEKALALGLKPMAYLREYAFAGQDPKEQLLLGPAYATQKLLAKTGMSVKDVDVWEIHEAFAGQVLANLNALDSETFCQENMNAPKVGRIDMEKINPWGGSLSLGHPFGATGVRLIATAANRLRREGGQTAVVTACAAGGLGVAMKIDPYPQ